MTAMEKVLSECNALAAGVTDRERRMKDSLAGLLLQLDSEISSTRMMVNNVSRSEREASMSQRSSMARAMVMEETKMSEDLVQQQVQQVPHVTPPALTTTHRCRGSQTVKKKGLLSWQKRARECGRSWRTPPMEEIAA